MQIKAVLATLFVKIADPEKTHTHKAIWDKDTFVSNLPADAKSSLLQINKARDKREMNIE